MRRYFFLFLLLLPLSLLAENASNVRARQNGKEIIITYDLKKKSKVELYAYINGKRKLTKVSGAVGKNVRAGRNVRITWSPLEEFKKEEIELQNVRFEVKTLDAYDIYSARSSLRGKRNIETFITADIARAFTVTQKSYGFMLGQTYRGAGWFINSRFFNFPKSTIGIASYSNDFYTGRVQSSMFVINTGLVLDIMEFAGGSPNNRFNTLGLYGGLGYGTRRVLWEAMHGGWLEENDIHARHNGLSGNFGVIGSIHGMTLKVGVNFIHRKFPYMVKYIDVEVGIGWMF